MKIQDRKVKVPSRKGTTVTTDNGQEGKARKASRKRKLTQRRGEKSESKKKTGTKVNEKEGMGGRGEKDCSGRKAIQEIQERKQRQAST